MQLPGKVVVVTGAGRGVGRAIAQRFAAEGAKVVIAEQRQHAGDETRRLITQAGGEALAVRTDVSQTTDVDAMLKATLAWAGRLDVLVNNAEITNRPGPLVKCRASDFDRVMAVNVRGAFLCTREALKILLKQGGGGRVISVASYAADLTAADLAPYTASKAALIALMRAVAAEVGDQSITVNSVCPAIVEPEAGGGTRAREAAGSTEEIDFKSLLAGAAAEIPPGRLQTPEEIAALCVFLATDEAADITGQAIQASGSPVSP